jgi:hypothetical protein
MTPDVEPVTPGAGARDGAALLFILGVLVAAVFGGLRMITDGAAGADPTFDLWMWVAAAVTTISTAGIIALVASEYQSHRRFGVGVALVTVGVLATAGVWFVFAAM